MNLQHHFAPIMPSGGKKKKRGSSAGIHWPVCKRCGLVLLVNDATEKARKAPCPGLE